MNARVPRHGERGDRRTMYRMRGRLLGGENRARKKTANDDVVSNLFADDAGLVASCATAGRR